MTTWGLVLEMTTGVGDRKRSEAYVLSHVEGSREEAMAELERRAREYRPEHPRISRRRRLFRYQDGFLLVVDGGWQTYGSRFTLAELLEDSDAPPRPQPGPGPETVPEPRPVQDAAPEPRPVREAAPEPEPLPEQVDPIARYDDGVPVKPAWLGRTDLS
ncbi:hypothetical protein ACQPZG_14900 [Streptomyces sp. CA-294286]|uniref:hypothetical protein n=1 Tax=Streptomyces sp. CA-294286 TaxID=3240070 RepID=UPI003D94CD9F